MHIRKSAKHNTNSDFSMMEKKWNSKNLRCEHNMWNLPLNVVLDIGCCLTNVAPRLNLSSHLSHETQIWNEMPCVKNDDVECNGKFPLQSVVWSKTAHYASTEITKTIKIYLLICRRQHKVCNAFLLLRFRSLVSSSIVAHIRSLSICHSKLLNRIVCTTILMCDIRDVASSMW